MKAKRIITLLSFLCFLLAGCASKNMVVSKNYESIKIKNGILLIPKLAKISFQQDGELFNTTEADSIKNFITDIYNKQFNNSLKSSSSFYKVGYIEFMKRPELAEQSLSYKEGILTIELPKQKLALEETGNLFILFIQDFELTFVQEEIDKSDPKKEYNAVATPGNILTIKERKNLRYYMGIRYKYAIFDQSNVGIVSYGIMSSKEPYTISKDLSEIVIKLLNKQADYMVKGTPFVD